MKRILSFLTLLTITISSFGVDLVSDPFLYSSTDGNEIAYYIKSREYGYYLNSVTGNTSTASDYGQFAFYKVDGIDNAYYIKSITESKWLNYDNTSFNANGNQSNVITLSDDKENYFILEKVGTYYKIRPVDTAGNAFSYWNWNGSHSAMGLWNSSGGNNVQYALYAVNSSETVVTSLSSISPTKAYQIATERGYMVVNTDQTLVLSSTSPSAVADLAAYNWAFIHCYGNTYIYSLYANKFVARVNDNECSLVGNASDATPVTIAENTANGDCKFKITYDDESGWLNNNGTGGFVLSSWKTVNNGNQLLIKEVTNYGYSENNVTIDGLTYNLSGFSATLTNGNKSCTGDLSIPATVEYTAGSDTYNFFVNGLQTTAFEYATITSVKVESPYLTTLADWSFANNSKITTIEIPYVETIGGSTFRSCSALTTVIAGEYLSTISGQAFEDDSKMECFVIGSTTAPTLKEWSSSHSSHLTFKVNDVVFFVPTEAIDSYKASSNWSYYNFVYQDIDKYTDSQLGYTASGVTVNGIKYDISGYKATITQGNKSSTITDVYIPAVIEYVDGSNTYTCKVKETKTAAFQNSSAIKTFTFESPTRLTSFGGWYFAGCSNLVEINLPEGITTLLNDYALGRMDNITKLTLPTTLTTIPNYTFFNDPKLTVIEFKSETPPTFSGSYMFKGTTVQGNITIVVPTEDAVTAYTTALASYTPGNFKAVITKDQYVTQSIEENNGVVTISGLVDDENIEDLADYISNNYSTATSVDMTNATILPSIEQEDVAVLQPTSSNILVYAPSETYNDLSGANIIIDGTCSNLVLTDKKDFAPTGAFTATAGTASRQLYAGLNTVCMPFAFSASDISSEAKVYTYSETRENTLSFTEVDNVEAGVPCLVEIPEGTATANYSIALSGASVAAAPASASPLVGTFVKQTLGTGKYKLNDEGKFVKTVAESVLWPFRFCLDISGAASNSFAITFSDDDPTSINSVAEEQGAADVVSIYGEDGVKRASLQKGINILKLANGKAQKVFIK